MGFSKAPKWHKSSNAIDFHLGTFANLTQKMFVLKFSPSEEENYTPAANYRKYTTDLSVSYAGLHQMRIWPEGLVFSYNFSPLG